MTLKNHTGEPFAFWLIKEFLGSPEDQADEAQPMTNRYTLLTGIAILVVIAIIRLLISL